MCVCVRERILLFRLEQCFLRGAAKRACGIPQNSQWRRLNGLCFCTIHAMGGRPFILAGWHIWYQLWPTDEWTARFARLFVYVLFFKTKFSVDLLTVQHTLCLLVLLLLLCHAIFYLNGLEDGSGTLKSKSFACDWRKFCERESKCVFVCLGVCICIHVTDQTDWMRNDVQDVNEWKSWSRFASASMDMCVPN